jgi:hypothetical protein
MKAILDEKGMGNILNYSLKDEKEFEDLKKALAGFGKEMSKIKGDIGENINTLEQTLTLKPDINSLNDLQGKDLF